MEEIGKKSALEVSGWVSLLAGTRSETLGQLLRVESLLFLFQKTVDFLDKNKEFLGVLFRRGKLAKFHPTLFDCTFHMQPRFCWDVVALDGEE